MKRIISISIIIALVCTYMLTGCSSSSGNGSDTKSDTTVTPTAAVTAAQGDVWHMEGWEEGLWNDVLPDDPWGNYPKLTEEFVWRQTDTGVKRNMEGNLYTTGWPIVKDKETLKVFTKQSARIVDVQTHYVVTNMEKKTNVHIEWTLAPEAELVTKRNLVLASGEFPDVFLGCGFSQTDELSYGSQQGIILPLNKYIDKYGYYVKKVLEYRPDLKSWITAPDGNVYSLPSAHSNFHVTYPYKGWINNDWLKKLGLKMPTTTDEYYNVLKAFKTQDPNGNGKADEMPLVGSPKGWNTKIENYFMMPFILNYPSHRIVNNGKISMSVDKPEYREGLKWLNKLYSEELLDRDSFVRDGNQLAQLGNNPNTEIIGSAPAGGYVIFLSSENGRDQHWTAMPPLKGPAGAQNVGYVPYQYSNGAFEITKSCKHPEVAYRWADWFYSLEWQQTISFGRLGKEWDYAGKGDPTLFGDGQAAYKKTVDEVESRSNIYWEAMGGPYFTPNASYRAAWTSSGGQSYDTRMYGYTRDLYKGHEAKELFPPLYIPLDKIDEYTQINTDFDKYVTESFAKFVTGELKINSDSDWNNYIKGLDKLGMKKLVDTDQLAYDQFLKNQKK